VKNSKVFIIIGSDSDLPVIKETSQVLNEFAVPFKIFISSAHRSPEKTRNLVNKAIKEEVKVIIAAAGAAAHLAGFIAAYFPLPVIGIPIKTEGLGGLDSLYSMVQMPPGVPEATVAINGAKNAGLLAIEILAVADKKLAEKLKIYKKNLAAVVEKKDKKLQKQGIENYLKK